jgi:hypothetical protein
MLMNLIDDKHQVVFESIVRMRQELRNNHQEQTTQQKLALSNIVEVVSIQSHSAEKLY